ncbi:MAG TPA: hypothetical protein DGG94_22490 [Micromonosporaceae bacterium]|nr:hypothetical protein [Micromonosporaceae bacterium]
MRAVDIGPEPPVKEVYELACRIADTAISLGSERVAGFLEFIRVDRQFWLGLSMEPPRILDGPVLYDDSGDSHQRIPFGLVGGTVLQLYDQADWATETALTHAAASVVAGNVPPLEDRMLADARTILRRGPEALLPQALVLAAISTEIRIKRLLEELANEAQRSLVQILLNSPRDYSVAAQSLFDLPLKAVSGRSLKDDDRDLWKATGVLFTDRNAVAHRGASREVSTIRADVGTALRIKRYLISVTNGEMSSTDLELRFVANVGPPEPKEYRKNAE